MRIRHWMILSAVLLILSGCGAVQKEPEASPSPSTFYGFIPPGDPVGTEAMSTPPATSTPKQAAETAQPTVQPTIQPQEAVNSEKENHSMAAEKPPVAAEPEGALITETGTPVDVIPIESEGSGLEAGGQTESVTGITSGFDENELPLIKLS